MNMLIMYQNVCTGGLGSIGHLLSVLSWSGINLLSVILIVLQQILILLSTYFCIIQECLRSEGENVYRAKPTLQHRANAF